MDAPIISTDKLSQSINRWADSGNPGHLLAALDEACKLIDKLAKRNYELEALRQTMMAVFSIEEVQ
jgi:hypothetical protein